VDTVKIASFLAFAVGIGLIAAIAVVLLVPAGVAPTETPAEQPTKTITLIATETASEFLFGIEGQEPTTPGPEIKVKVGDIIKIILKNMGKIPHSFAITAEKKFDAAPLFNAAIGSGSSPLEAGKTGSITFKPNRPGEYYYICQVPGHIELGMWGRFIVEE